MIESYENKSVLRGLILGITANLPIVGGIVTGVDTAIMGALEEARWERLYTLLDELDTGTKHLTNKVVISDPLIYACHITIEATVRTQRHEKVRAFARLIVAGIEDQPRLDLEREHEDFLKILDELSYREIGLLATLEEYESKHPIKEEENDLQRAGRFWDNFSQQVCSKYSIKQDELDAWMTRLNRTGMYETFVGMYLDFTGGKGKLTPTYHHLSSLIRSQPGRFNTGRVT